MKFTALKDREDLTEGTVLSNVYNQFKALHLEIQRHELPEHFVGQINEQIEHLNNTSLWGKELKKLIQKQQASLLKSLEKELKLVPKNYYRNLWLAMGMSGFGIPIGVTFGLLIDNLGLLGLGLPIGMAMGMAVGASLDKKALEENRQLNIELKSYL